MTDQALRDVKLISETLGNLGGQKYFASIDKSMFLENRNATAPAVAYATTPVGAPATPPVVASATTLYKGDLKEKEKGDIQKALPKVRSSN